MTNTIEKYYTENNPDDAINNSELENDYMDKNLKLPQERGIDNINNEKDVKLERNLGILKVENRESRKQQCFKCGKVMSSRWVLNLTPINYCTKLTSVQYFMIKALISFMQCPFVQKLFVFV